MKRAILILCLLTIPFSTRAEVGVAHSRAEFRQAYLDLVTEVDYMRGSYRHPDVIDGQVAIPKGVMAYCVCAGDRSRVVYATSVYLLHNLNTIGETQATVYRAAKPCGGCVGKVHFILTHPARPRKPIRHSQRKYSN